MIFPLSHILLPLRTHFKEWYEMNKLVSLAAIGLMLLASPGHAQIAGGLDPAFHPTAFSGCALMDLHIDEAGSIFVVCASPAPTAGYDIDIAKFDRDGRIDTTWGTAGTARISQLCNVNTYYYCPFSYAAPARDGGFLLALHDGSIVKFLPNGAVDTRYRGNVANTYISVAAPIYGDIKQLADGGLQVLSESFTSNQAQSDPRKLTLRTFRPDGTLSSQRDYAFTQPRLPDASNFIQTHVIVAWSLNGENLEILAGAGLNASRGPAPDALHLYALSASGKQTAITDHLLPAPVDTRFQNVSLAVLPDARLAFAMTYGLRKWLPDGSVDPQFSTPDLSLNYKVQPFQCDLNPNMQKMSLRAGGELTLYIRNYYAADHLTSHCNDYLALGFASDGLAQLASDIEMPNTVRTFKIARSGNLVTFESAPGSTTATLSRRIGHGTQATINVVEFHNTITDHYFMTSYEDEIAFVDLGNAGPGWSRTGHVFGAWNIDTAMPGTNPVCRYHGDAIGGPNSYFYSAEKFECDLLHAQDAATPIGQASWRFERDAFRVTVPVNGQCLPNLTPVYRLYNRGSEKGIESNHRYVTSVAEYAAMQARGWIGDGIHMCATHG